MEKHLDQQDDEYTQDSDNSTPLPKKISDLPGPPTSESESSPNLSIASEVFGVRLQPAPPPHKDGRIRHFVCEVAAELKHKTGRIFPYYFNRMSLTQKDRNFLYGKMGEYERSHVPKAWPHYKIPKPKVAKKREPKKPRLPKKRKDNRIGPMDLYVTKPNPPKPKPPRKPRQPSKLTLDMQRADRIMNSRTEELVKEDLPPSRTPSPPFVPYRGYWIEPPTNSPDKDNTSPLDKKPPAV